MRGVASLARETGAPVVPVAIWGSQRTLVRRRPGRARPEAATQPDGAAGGSTSSFGEPITCAAGDDLVGLTRRLGALLTDQLEELQRLPHHVPAPGERAPWYPAHLGGHAPTRAEAAHLDVVPRSAVSPTWGPA